MNEIAKSRLETLPEKEKKYLEAYLRNKGLPLAPTVQAQFFELFLNGRNLDEIHQMNPTFPYGAIVMASIEGGWAERREAHITGLLENVRSRLNQIQLESVSFISDALAAAHKKYGEKFKRYLQTGDPSELGHDWIRSFRQYKEALQILMLLTGQDEKKGGSGNTINVFASPDALGPESGATPASKQVLDGSTWSPKIAGKILKAIEEGEGE